MANFVISIDMALQCYAHCLEPKKCLIHLDAESSHFDLAKRLVTHSLRQNWLGSIIAYLLVNVA